MQEINKLKGDRKTSPSPHLITRYRLGSRDGVIQRESNHERNIEYRGQSRSGAGGSRGLVSWCEPPITGNNHHWPSREASCGAETTRPPDHRPQPRTLWSPCQASEGEKHPKQRFNQKHRDPNCLHSGEKQKQLKILLNLFTLSFMFYDYSASSRCLLQLNILTEDEDLAGPTSFCISEHVSQFRL